MKNHKTKKTTGPENELHHVKTGDICLCENKGADQLCSNCTADQRLCFHFMDSTNPLLKFKISSF